ncbi:MULTISPECIES: catalase [unclassified Acidovorax]|uniref:catalase n=1 Tax=unclassified Acidovorax TaxID=2684926 RepID=UPI002883196A|nr:MULTISPECIES: catalase [unclassified Acidovorax]
MPRKNATPPPSASDIAARSAARNTDSGPAQIPATAGDDVHVRKAAGANALAASMPNNTLKPLEHGVGNGLAPNAGLTSAPDHPDATGSTLSEKEATAKTGAGATPGLNANNGVLDRARVDSTGQVLTTNQGVPISDNQNSLKQGVRGPVLLEDFVLREKLTHFDHERIPERIVHARGSGAHGTFECYEPLTDLTVAAPFQEAGKKTPVFVRFSTVQGERGSKDTARDVRGFAVKFYTDAGNWDLVGNNMPVFFIQDAMKFPDLVHAVKPEPHNQIPQAASAHDTFWDFVSLMPESTHMLMWVMSDRGIPRSYATMQGFGVHTFRFVNAEGTSVFVKFHWTPLAGTHSLVWDEAVKISGADPDFHRRDLWERIESGAFPEYELAVQVFTEEQAESFSFDILDATKIVPEELVPLRPIGKMTLHRNPDNFFAETEQVAFCTAHVVPGIDFSNDPLLAGRIHSYVDTQISRLGGPNFHEIPINTPLAPVHNNQRDGMHRQNIPRGRVSYEPNSLAGGCPFQAGAVQGFMSVPARAQAKEEQVKIRAKPEKFADHYTQAKLFYESQAAHEQAHIAAAFRFELSKVTVPAVRERTVAMLRNVSESLATSVAHGIGIRTLPPALPKAIDNPAAPEIDQSPALSLLARPGDGSIKGRKVAILVADGVAATALLDLQAELLQQGAVGRFVAPHIGPVVLADGTEVDADASLENSPGFLFDGLVLPDGEAGVALLARDGHAAEFVRDQFRHCKPILVLGASQTLLVDSGIPMLAEDPALIVTTAEHSAAMQRFIAALGQPRNFARESDPPAV